MFAKGVNRSYFSKLIKKLSSSLLLIVSAAENASSTIGYLQILPILFKRKRSSSLNNPKTCANCCMAATATHRDTAFLFFHVISHHDESSNAILGNYTQKIIARSLKMSHYMYWSLSLIPISGARNCSVSRVSVCFASDVGSQPKHITM